MITITALYAGLLGLWFLLLSLRVIRRRQTAQINLGDGGDAEMLRRIRGHGNFAEYAPMVLVLLAIAELGGAVKWLLHLAGATLLAGRLLHGYALSFTEKFFAGRFWGMILTFAALLVAAGLCVWQGLRALQ